MKVNPLFLRLQNDPPAPITVLQGGGDAAKTITVLQIIGLALTQRPNLIATITDDTIPAIKGGALRAWQRYVLPDLQPYITSYNQTERVYKYFNNGILEFRSFQDELDARGQERDYLFMNECNKQHYQMFWQLERKTRIATFLDYNPTAPFWVHEKLIRGGERQYAGKWRRYIVDHRHNLFLSADDHARYESISDPEMFRVYSRGLTGRVQGLIFAHFKPAVTWGERSAYSRVMWGIDYGYTNDPTAIVKIGIDGRRRVCKEVAYTPGLSAETIKNIFLINDLQPQDEIYSEADPNMVNQLRILGLNVMPAIKGPGSIAAGISKTREYDCYYMGENFHKEINTWSWVKAQDIVTGKEVWTNQPVDAWNHLCDATRMAIYTDSFRNR